MYIQAATRRKLNECLGARRTIPDGTITANGGTGSPGQEGVGGITNDARDAPLLAGSGGGGGYPFPSEQSAPIVPILPDDRTENRCPESQSPETQIPESDNGDNTTRKPMLVRRRSGTLLRRNA